MKLPNGYGSVYKLSGKRRKPWVARKTTGWEVIYDKKQAYPKYKIIGYYEKREDAIEALAMYNKNPYDINASKITFSEVFDKWSDKKFEEISRSNINAYNASYRLCDNIKDMRFVDIKLSHLQEIVDNSGKNYPTLRKLKVLFGQLFDYAIMHEIIPNNKNLVEYVDISKAKNPNAFDREPFTKKEIKTLWNYIDSNEYISVILILIYTGVRIGELLELKKENVNLDEKYFEIIASKTKSGIRRVPIADKIHNLIKKWYSKNKCEYLISTPDDKKFKYWNYYDSYWTPIMNELNFNHKIHDTRHTCVSLLTMSGVDERIIKKIVGHKGQGVTQIVYTHIEMEELLKAINLI